MAAVYGGGLGISCERGRRPRRPAPPLPGIGSDDSRRALPRHRFPEAPSAAPFPGGLVRGRAGSPAADALPQGALPAWWHSCGGRVPHKGAPFGGAASSGDPLVFGARLPGTLRCYFTLAPGGSGGGRGWRWRKMILFMRGAYRRRRTVWAGEQALHRIYISSTSDKPGIYIPGPKCR